MPNLTEIIKESFSQYAGAVLQSRALVDVRDCLKPSARQIFYCLHTDKFTADKPFKKTLKCIGSAMRVYIHGDASCEGVIMRAGQPFSMRYPLVEVEGSYGNLMESGNWAAPRYTESRLSPLANYLFAGVKKNTISEWRDNYDDTEKYPAVLPSIGFYNIVNGAFGIGVGAATSIPPFNLTEVNQALIQLVRDENSSDENIICYPDFPTGGVILNKEEVKESLLKGTGAACKIRSIINYEPNENCLIVSEIPFGVYTKTICEELENILNDESNTLIERFIDLTGEKPLIKIYLKKKANPKRVVDFLFKNTSLESFYAINLTMLEDGRFPRVFGWREALLSYIKHMRNCKQREIEFDLQKAEDRAEILEGLLTAVANIDEVVSIIRHSNNSEEASKKLTARFAFTENQVKAILNLKLQRLLNIEAIKIEKELDDLKQLIDDYLNLLNNKDAFDRELISILQEVIDKFGDERRTKILSKVISEKEELVPEKEKDLTLMVLSNKTIYLTDAEKISGSKRGRKGLGLKLPKNVILEDIIYTTNLSSIFFITKKGKIYSCSIADLEEDKETSIYQLINLPEDDSLLKVVSSKNISYSKYIIFVTKLGMIKKSLCKDYRTKATKGLVALRLKEDDEVVNCFLSSDETDRIMITSNSGNYNFYNHKDILPIGRVSLGVKAIKLKDNEFVASATIVYNSKQYSGILSISSSGRGKITPLEDFTETSRAIKGNSIQKIESGESIKIAQAVLKDAAYDLLSNNRVVSLSAKDIPIQNRATVGVNLINIKDVETDLYLLRRIKND